MRAMMTMSIEGGNAGPGVCLEKAYRLNITLGMYRRVWNTVTYARFTWDAAVQEN